MSYREWDIKSGKHSGDNLTLKCHSSNKEEMWGGKLPSAPFNLLGLMQDFYYTKSE